MNKSCEEKHAQIRRLQFVVAKLAGKQGVDISELIEEKYLEEGDMD